MKSSSPILALVVATLITSAGCRSARDDVESLLGATLPANGAVAIHRVQPSPDLAATAWYVRFPSTVAEHTDLVTRARLRPDGVQHLLRSSLGEPPAAWAALPAPSTTQLQRTAESDQAITSIAATHHEGHTYLLVERIPRPSPGPW